MIETYSPEEIRTALSHCIGTQGYTRHWTKALVYTDGVEAMAHMCGAHWLVDAIASYVPDINRLRENDPYVSFHLWTLNVSTENTQWYRREDGEEGQRAGDPVAAQLVMRLDADTPALIHQDIEYTNFPLPEGITLYMQDGGPGYGWVLMLRSEY